MDRWELQVLQVVENGMTGTTLLPAGHETPKHCAVSVGQRLDPHNVSIYGSQVFWSVVPLIALQFEYSKQPVFTNNKTHTISTTTMQRASTRMQLQTGSSAHLRPCFVLSYKQAPVFRLPVMRAAAESTTTTPTTTDKSALWQELTDSVAAYKKAPPSMVRLQSLAQLISLGS